MSARQRESSKPICAVLLFALMFAPGCKLQTQEAALEADANGYLCLKCDARFYTKRDLFAEKCPRCRDTDIRQVSAYVCPRDQTTMLAPRGGSGPICPKCNQRIQSVKSPSAAELSKWGATESKNVTQP